MGLAAANWSQCTSVETKFEVQDWFAHSFGVKAIPISLNYVLHCCTNILVDIRVDVKVLVKLVLITEGIPDMDI